MRAISLWQPFASLVACGAKTVETRPREWRFRGPLAIHAAKYMLSNAERWSLGTKFWAAVHLAGLPERLPYGCIVATCVMDLCIQTEQYEALMGPLSEANRAFGDFSEGRWALGLRDIKQLVTPVPFRGAQGLFEVPDELLKGEMACRT